MYLHSVKFEETHLVQSILHVGNTQPAFTCSKLARETLEQGTKYVQS